MFGIYVVETRIGTNGRRFRCTESQWCNGRSADAYLTQLPKNSNALGMTSI
jgi:hypothetical protein